jgi:L-asparaginase II
VRPATGHRLRVEVRRGDHLESLHEVWCAASPAVPSRWAADSASLPATFMRSAAKPFQLLPLLVAGGAERWSFEAADLAVMCASHDGTDAHAQRVAAILARVGLGAEALRCGVHRPYFLDSLPADSPERQRVFGPLHNNCSGNHAALLALALMHDVHPADYLDPRTAGQQRIHAVLAALTGSETALSVDDCGAPCYWLPLAGMAAAYEFLASPQKVFDLPLARRSLLRSLGPLERTAAELERIAAAMAREPQWVSGEETGAAHLSRALPGELVAKHGAEGVLCVAHRGRGAALALKVQDGASRALLPALLPLLGELGWLSPEKLAGLDAFVVPVLRGRHGQPIGQLRLTPPARAHVSPV